MRPCRCPVSRGRRPRTTSAAWCAPAGARGCGGGCAASPPRGSRSSTTARAGRSRRRGGRSACARSRSTRSARRSRRSRATPSTASCAPTAPPPSTGSGCGSRRGTARRSRRCLSTGSAPSMCCATATTGCPSRASSASARSTPRSSSCCRRAAVLAAQPVPAVELEALGHQLLAALLREPRQHRLERLLLLDARVERLLAAHAGGDLQRLAARLAEGGERVDEELAVGDGRGDLHRGVPRGEHGEVVLVEVGQRLGVVRRELLVGDLVDPRADQLAEQLAAGLATDRLDHDADRILRIDEAEGHVGVALFASGGDGTRGTLGMASDGIVVWSVPNTGTLAMWPTPSPASPSPTRSSTGSSPTSSRVATRPATGSPPSGGWRRSSASTWPPSARV